jgi:hypothetical protein
MLYDFQQSLVLRQYLPMLSTPVYDLGQKGVNILLLCAALLNILAFALPPLGHETQRNSVSSHDDGLNDSSIFSTSEDHVGWLAPQAGVRPLLRSMAPYTDETLRFLDTVFTGNRDDKNITIRPVAYNLNRATPAWRRIFELEESRNDGSCGIPEGANSLAAHDIFQAPVRSVAWLRDLEPKQPNVFKHLMFLSKVHTHFRALLYQREERAVWLFGYWLGLMCRFKDMWWCGPRVRRDFAAVSGWLAAQRLPERLGVQGEKWKEMMGELESLRISV